MWENWFDDDDERKLLSHRLDCDSPQMCESIRFTNCSFYFYYNLWFLASLACWTKIEGAQDIDGMTLNERERCVRPKQDKTRLSLLSGNQIITGFTRWEDIGDGEADDNRDDNTRTSQSIPKMTSTHSLIDRGDTDTAPSQIVFELTNLIIIINIINDHVDGHYEELSCEDIDTY